MAHHSPLQTFGRSIRRVLARPSVELDPVQAYDLWAATYDDRADNALLHVETEFTGRIIDHIPLKGKSVLDAGCGTGRLFPRILAGDPACLDGIDISANMLHEAAAGVKPDVPAFLQVANVESLPFRDQRFDLVITTLVLDHIPDLQGALAELCRVLRGGGDLIISTFHPFGKLLSWKRTFQAEATPGRKDWFSAKYYLHLHADYFATLKSAGMEILQMQEPVIDERVRPFYERTGKLDIFERFKGFPMLLVIHARKR